MTSPSIVEVIPGILRIREVRAVLGSAFAATDFVDVLVLGPVGERASVGRVELGRLAGGGGVRRGLLCPACGGVVQNLLTDNDGGFRCRACRGRRTRRQLERSNRGWNRLGGRQEDQLFRHVLRDAWSTTKIERVQRAIVQLLADDRRRVMLTLSKAESAIEAASFGSWL